MLAGWPTRSGLGTPCVWLADAGARQARTQPVWRGSTTRTGEDAVWRDAGAARRAQGVPSSLLGPGFGSGVDPHRLSVSGAGVMLARPQSRKREEGALAGAAHRRCLALDCERVRGAVLRHKRHLHRDVGRDARPQRGYARARARERELRPCGFGSSPTAAIGAVAL